MTVLVTGLLAVTFMASACGSIGAEGDGGSGGSGSSGGDGGDKGTITIGYVAWDEDIVVTEMWKRVLEKEGYTVETTELGDVGPAYQGVASGDLDLFMDAWLPVLHKDYVEQYGDDMEELGTWYGNATQALTVPSYVKGVDSVADLKGKADEFGGKVYGIEAGAGIMQAADQTIQDYGLSGEYELPNSSTPAMLSQLKKSYEAKEPVIVTLWRPHWAYNNYDLKDLEDPKVSMGKPGVIKTYARSGFSEEFPEVAGWLKDFKMSDNELFPLEDTALIQHEDNPEEGVQQWMDENQDFVKGLTD